MHVIYEPMELMERLAALVPPPRFEILVSNLEPAIPNRLLGVLQYLLLEILQA
jgi:hypothetical protein